MGTASPFAVATHSTTVPTNVAPVTVAFTTQATSTLALGPLSTFSKTETSLSTVTKTVTAKLTGTVFTTTSTVHVFDRRFVNITTTFHSVWITSEPYAINLQVPTIEGWIPVNTSTAFLTTKTISLKDGRLRTTVVEVPTATPSSEGAPTAADSIPSPLSAASALGPTVTAAPPAQTNQIVYILEGGRLVPTPLTAVSALISSNDFPIGEATDAEPGPTQVSPEITTIPSSLLAEGAPTVTAATLEITTVPKDPPTVATAAIEQATEVTTIPGAPTETAALTPDDLDQALLVKELLKAMSSADADIAHAMATAVPADDDHLDDKTAVLQPATTLSTVTGSPAMHTPTPLSGPIDEFDDTEADQPEGIITTSKRLTATTIVADATNTRSLQRLGPTVTIKPALAKRALTKVPKYYFGLRGNLIHDPTRQPPSYPTEVLCTKSLLAETTIYSPLNLGATFVTPEPVTRTTTTLKLVTVTLTIPSPSPFRTASYVTTKTLTTTSTHFESTTSVSTQTHTVSRTRTAFAACNTQNLLGPKVAGDAHIVNLYALGPYKYTSFDFGTARNAEECCVECHDLSTPCLGSIWDMDARRCMLVTDPRSQCLDQETAGGVFVTRPRDERGGIGRHKWPEWIVSNGPCGLWIDAGTGW
ncbi:Grx4 family monothiol glutaredoxin [Sphaceloma murrayae]|uniref:Grx4 family monothiol glutaredoxin n=1 Tax=Sphaceloma murrayae TaxID=2082308 RepID=A0A2K1QLD8_9PEZI|nr:Grx4 family monothiol glutaredoxin [Sphaceloma murrayae]